MNPFSLLSTQTKDTRRPPRLTPRADVALINRLVPGRIQPRQAAQALQPDNSASQTTPKQKNGRKSPLAQAPAGILRFPTVSTQLFGPTSNGNLKAQPNITQTNGHSRPSVVVNPNQAVSNQKNGALDVPLNLHKPVIDIQQAEESEKERRTTFDAPDEPGLSQQKPKPEERAHETQPVTCFSQASVEGIIGAI